MNQTVLQWFRDNRSRLWVFLALILVGILCFEAGLLQGRIKQTTPLVLSLPSPQEGTSLQTPIAPEQKRETINHVEPIGTKNTSSCVFVGSKNSNKYHLSTCSVAKRIKQENRVCFATKEEAEKRGYVPSCLK